MSGGSFADANEASTGELKARIDFGYAFAQPERPNMLVMPKQQMGVFVENELERLGAAAAQGQDDKIFIAAAAEIGREADRFAFVKWKERDHIAMVGKGHYNYWRRSDRFRARHGGVGLAELLEARDKFCHLLGWPVAESAEMGALKFGPGLVGQPQGRGVGRGAASVRCEAKEKQGRWNRR